MREILFRGKTKESGEWVQGYLVYAKSDFDGEECREADIIPHDTDRVYKGEYNIVFPCIPESIGQYTGFTDEKNGKKIFEGDIVKYTHFQKFFENEELKDAEEKEQRIDVIRFKGGKFFPLPHREDCFGDYWYSWAFGDFEVIGNIHDNPELLEGNNG